MQKLTERYEDIRNFSREISMTMDVIEMRRFIIRLVDFGDYIDKLKEDELLDEFVYDMWNSSIEELVDYYLKRQKQFTNGTN